MSLLLEVLDRSASEFAARAAASALFPPEGEEEKQVQVESEESHLALQLTN
jgi:hypothetical protein